MEIITITAVLSVLAVLAMAWRLPPAMRQPTARQVLVVLIWGPPPPRHQAPADTRSAQQRWDDGPRSMDLAAEQAARTRAGLPVRRYTAQQLAAMDAGLDQARAIAAEPRPGLLALPAPTDHISGAARVPQTDGAGLPPGAWRQDVAAALGPLADPPGPIHAGNPGPINPVGYLRGLELRGVTMTAPPEPEPEPEPEDWQLGAMHWEPSRLASRQAQVDAWCSAQDADALLTIERIRTDCSRALAGLRLQLAGGAF